MSSPPGLWLVYRLPDDETLSFRQFPATGKSELVAALRALPEGSQGLAFCGQRLAVTAAPNRLLVFPDGDRVPLFDPPPPPGQTDESVFLGFGQVPGTPVDADYAGLLTSLQAGESPAADDGDDAEDEEPEDEDDDDTLPANDFAY